MAKKTASKKAAATTKPAAAAKSKSRPTKSAPAAKAKPVAKSVATTVKAAPAKVAKVAKKAVSKVTAATSSSTPSKSRPVGDRPVGDLPPGRRVGDGPVVQHKPEVAPPGKKVSSGLSKKDLENFRELLLEKRRELVGDMSSMEREALRNSGGSNLSSLPIHMADQGTDNYEQEFTLGLVEKDRVLLREINRALAKIQDGSYGICEGTGLPISRPRLEAQPWARYSIEYARQMEKRGVR